MRHIGTIVVAGWAFVVRRKGEGSSFRIFLYFRSLHNILVVWSGHFFCPGLYRLCLDISLDNRGIRHSGGLFLLEVGVFLFKYRRVRGRYMQHRFLASTYPPQSDITKFRFSCRSCYHSAELPCTGGPYLCLLWDISQRSQRFLSCLI